MDDMRDKPAGWYPSPNSTDEEWYWNGEAWKERRANGETRHQSKHPTVPRAPSHQTQGTQTPGVAKASYGQRFVANLLDSLLIFLPAFVGVVVLLLLGVVNLETDTFGANNVEIVGVGAVLALVALGAAVVGLNIWNQVLRQGRTGQTLGKKAMGLRLVDVTTLEPVGYGRAFGRAALGWVLGIIPKIGGLLVLVDLLWPLWDKQGQRLIDKAVSSRVISA